MLSANRGLRLYNDEDTQMTISRRALLTTAAATALPLARARAQEAMFGSRSYHRERYATLLGY